MPHVSDKLVLAGVMLTTTLAGAAHAEYASVAPASVQPAKARLIDVESALADGEMQLTEGDILVGPALQQRGIGIGLGKAVWEDGIVPYYIDPVLAPVVVENINNAIDTWNEVAGISLLAIDPGNADSPADYLHFTPANGCASWVGRQGGAQPVWTAPSCSSGSIMHEIGHALGLEHEHTRPDRDQYINIIWQNIDIEKVRNFDISSASKQNYGTYDYASIMHYGEYFFSANGGPTIRAIQADNPQIGQRIAPSAGDIEAIAALYSSDLSLISNVVNKNGQSEVSLLVTNESLQGANQIVIELDTGTAQMLSSNNSDWQCTAHNRMLKCSKARMSEGSHSTLVLLIDEHMTELALNPRLTAKTPDLNPNNNNGAFSPVAANAVFSDNSEEPYAKHPSLASAGGVGVWMFGVLILIMPRRLVAKRLKISLHIDN